MYVAVFSCAESLWYSVVFYAVLSISAYVLVLFENIPVIEELFSDLKKANTNNTLHNLLPLCNTYIKTILTVSFLLLSSDSDHV